MGPIGLGLTIAGSVILGLGALLAFVTIKNETGIFRNFFKSYKKEEEDKNKELFDNKQRIYMDFARMYNEIRNTFIEASQTIDQLYSNNDRVNSDEIKKFKDRNTGKLQNILNSYQLHEIEYTVEEMDYLYLKQLIKYMTSTNSTAWRNSNEIVETLRILDGRVKKYIIKKEEN